jgi:hypothetical protein
MAIVSIQSDLRERGDKERKIKEARPYFTGIHSAVLSMNLLMDKYIPTQGICEGIWWQSPMDVPKTSLSSTILTQ